MNHSGSTRRVRGTVARVALVLALLAGAGLSAGCLWAGAAVATKFVMSNYEGVIDAPIDDVVAASKAEMRARGLTIVEDRRDSGGQHEIEGEDAQGRKVRLNIDPIGNATSLSVRAGLLGNKDEGRFFYEAIAARIDGDTP